MGPRDTSSSSTSYDEVFDPVGALRRPYAELQRRLGFDVLNVAAATADRLCDRPLGDDVRILPIPWVLDSREYSSVVQAGMLQRARALQMFFADVVLGRGEFLESNTSLTGEQFQAILNFERTSLPQLRSPWRGHAPDDIRFVNGPDLMRSPDGDWLVLEDNVGCVGGSADSSFVWSRYTEATGATSLMPPVEPDLQRAVQRWLGCLGLTPRSGAVVGLLGCEHTGDELERVLIHENERRRLVLEATGIAVWDECRCQRSLEKTGSVRAIVNFHAGHPLVEEAFRRRIPLFNAPGTGILGNKALLPHVDDMIRFYCRERPLVATPPTHVLEDGVLPAEPDGWIVKSVSGCQGTEVFALASHPRDRLEAIGRLVRGLWPASGFVAQRRVEPSHLSTSASSGWEQYLVELRPVTYVVGWADIHVSSQPVGKAISRLDARRKHNLSQGACYVPVTCC